MPVEAEIIYRTRDQIVADLIQRMQSRVPDIHVEEDGNFRMFAEVLAEVLEGVYLANQIQRDNIFIPTANLVELRRHGEQFGLAIKSGLPSSGDVLFSGAGGTFIPIGTVIGSDVGGGDTLYYVTTQDATLPNPGIPSAPTLVDISVGNLPAGTYEYAVTFQTAYGETELGEPSAPLTIGASRNITVNDIPIGGSGTIARNLYRRVNGGSWTKLTAASVGLALNNNGATNFTDNTTTLGGPPPDESTAERIETTAESEEPGEAYNASTGTIRELIEVPDGVTDVTNTSPFTGGSDEEDMESYRSRLLDHIRNPRTGSPADLEGWAEEIDGVETATAFSNDNMGVATNGHVTVRIAGPGGTIPSADVQQAVYDRLVEENIANIIIHVGTFTPVSTNVTVTITLQSGYALADVSASVQEAVAAYINEVPVGNAVYVAGIYDAVFGLPGIATLVVNVPATDQTATATQKRVPGTITVS